MSSIIAIAMEVLPWLLAIFAVFVTANFAGAYSVWKGFAIQLAEATNAFNNVMQEVVTALEDDEITEEEFRLIFSQMIVVYIELQDIIALVAQLNPLGFLSRILPVKALETPDIQRFAIPPKL